MFQRPINHRLNVADAQHSRVTRIHRSLGASSARLEISFSLTHTDTQTHPFNGPFSGTTQVRFYQKGKTNLDFTEARDSEWHVRLTCLCGCLMQLSCDLNDDIVSEQTRQDSVWWQHYYVSELL